VSGEAGVRLHIVHVSSAAGVAAVQRAREAGVAITAETCPHYLTITDAEIEASVTGPEVVLWKCAPPIRSAADRQAIWSALADGTLSLIASDHSPAPPALKCLDSGDLARAWGGIPSLQLALPLVWTPARARGFGVADVVRWMCQGPAELAGLGGRKGTIAVGADADLVAWDPEVCFRVDPSRLHHRHRISPYKGMALSGEVARTWIRGQLVYDRGAFGSPATGSLIRARFWAA
jgi:allantoinase